MNAAVEKMRAEGLPEVAVETFARHLSRLGAGERGVLSEAEIEPVDELPDAEELPDDPAGAEEALRRAVVIKLNGGLGTSMGMTQAKSLLEVKDGLTFLDIIARQVLGLRERAGAPVPLVLMNSFATREDSLAALERYPDLALEGLPLDFPQGKVPKLLEEGLEPAGWPADPKLEWAPPGHGDLYPSLSGSGMLDALLERGFEYAFVSNSDNLGATLDLRILDLVRERGHALPHGGRRPHAVGPQGRPPRPAPGGRAGAAGDRPDPGRGCGLVPGRESPPVLQHQHDLGEPARAGRRARRERRRGRASDDREPQDRGPEGLVVARGGAARDRDGGGHRRVRGRGRGAGAPEPLRSREGHRATCSRCARTPT